MFTNMKRFITIILILFMLVAGASMTYAHDPSLDGALYINKSFNLYLFNYLSKPYKFEDIEILQFSGVWVVFNDEKGNTHYVPVSNVARLELIK